MSEVRTQLLPRVVDTVTIGIILLDPEQRVVFWNGWMERHSPFLASAAEGRTLTELFPEIANGRVQHAVTSALTTNLSSMLSQSLNKSPFPLFSTGNGDGNATRMQQAIQVMPIHDEQTSRHCLVQVTDVTLSVSREKLLREQALVLRRHSYFDVLTSIANRRRFDEYSDEEFRRARRTTSSLSLVFIDIDHFKRYNDYYGHQGGDQCLKQVAATLVSVLQRPADLLARYGGEEFVAVLPETDEEGAQKIAEMMRARVAGIHLEHAASPTAPYVTISVGTATRMPQRDDVLASLIRDADCALYHAKQTGRNRVMTATACAQMPAVIHPAID